jgi:hypothetical protein
LGVRLPQVEDNCSSPRGGSISKHTNGLETNKNFVIVPDGNRNSERMCWRGPGANYQAKTGRMTRPLSQAIASNHHNVFNCILPLSKGPTSGAWEPPRKIILFLQPELCVPHLSLHFHQLFCHISLSLFRYRSPRCYIPERNTVCVKTESVNR